MKMNRLISLSLAILIFGSNFGYALNIHYCGGQISKVSFAFNPKNCGMETKKENEVPFKKELSKKSCCEDNTLIFQDLKIIYLINLIIESAIYYILVSLIALYI